MERKHSMLCRTFIAVLSAVATVFLVAGCAERCDLFCIGSECRCCRSRK